MKMKLHVCISDDSDPINFPYVTDLVFRQFPTYESLRYRVLALCAQLASLHDLSVSITCSLDNFIEEIVFKYFLFSLRCPHGRSGCSRILAHWISLSLTPKA